jgi:hypothetical protein
MSILAVNIPVPVAGDGPAVDVSALVGKKTVMLSGGFAGTYDLLASHDGSAGSYTPILQFNAGASESVRQTVSGAFKYFRIRSNARALGPVVCEVSAIAVPGLNRFLTVGSLPPGFQGFSPVVDTAVVFPPGGAEADVCFICVGSLVGQVVILGSIDGTDFNPVGSFRADDIPEGSPTSVLEFSVLATEDKVRYLRLYVSGLDTVGGAVVTMGGSLAGSGGTTPSYISELVTNAAGSDLLAGEVVRISGDSAVSRAQSDTLAHAEGLAGVMLADTALGALGELVNSGRAFVLLEPGLTPVAGKELWVSPAVAGRATTTEPLVRAYLGIIKDASSYGTTGGVVADLAPSAEQPVPTVATWPIDQVGYFFLDRKNGDDSHSGYIIAPPGTVFTPAQTAAVAIKTTSRLEQVRPVNGAGRMCVTLFKAYGDGIPYDHLPGDGHGREDRRQITNYAIFHTRGSDLTNSIDDRYALGSTAVDGPYVVASTSVSGDGLAIKCTTPIATPALAMAGFRLRVVPAGGGNPMFAPCRYGDTTSPPANDVVTVWPTYSLIPVNPGDTIYLDIPGATLYRFYEAPSYEVQLALYSPPGPPDYPRAPSLELGGISFRGYAQIGCEFDTEDRQARYCFVRCEATCIISGSLLATTDWIDESGASLQNGAFSLRLDAGCSMNDPVDRIILSESAGFGSAANLYAETLVLNECQFDNLVALDGTSKMQLIAVDYGEADLSPRTSCEIFGCRWLKTGLGLVLAPEMVLSGSTTPAAAGADFTIGNVRSLDGVEPAQPGIVMHYGRYSVMLDFAVDGEDALFLNVGSGVLVYYDFFQSLSTPVTWDSLETTGFDIENGQKVVCRRRGASTNRQHYYGDMLPCPRGIVMRMVDGVAGTAYPVGLVVESPGVAVPDRFDLALADPGSPKIQLAGYTLTNIVQGDGSTAGGYAVVGDDPIGVLRKIAAVPASPPAPGDLVYLSDVDPGYVVAAPPALVVSLGRALPVGPDTTLGADTVVVAWEPEMLGIIPPVTFTLAQTYNTGASAADQTMTLADVRGGGVVVDGSGGGFSGAYTLQIKDDGGNFVNFARAGGVEVVQTFTVTQTSAILATTTFNISPPAGVSTFRASENDLIFDPAAPAGGFNTITLCAARNSVHIPSTCATSFGSNSEYVYACYNTVLNEGSGTIGEFLIGSYNEAIHSGAGAMHRTYGSWNIGRLTAGSGQYIAGTILKAVNEHGAVNSMIGAESSVEVTGIAGGDNPTVNTAYGFRSSITTVRFAGTAIITSAYDFYAKNSTPSDVGYPMPPFTFGTITNYYGLYVEEHTHGANNWSVYVAGGTSFFGGDSLLQLQSNVTIAAPIAGSVWNGLDVQASTLTLAAGGTVPTSLSLAYLAAPTITSAAAYVVPTAATLTIAGPPVAGGALTITNPASLVVLAGNVGIGTNAPGDVLHVRVSNNVANLWVRDSAAIGHVGGVGLDSLNNSFNGILPFVLRGNPFLLVGDVRVGCTIDPNSSMLLVESSKTIASAAGAVWDGVKFAASTASITGATGITTAAGFNFITIQAPTINCDTAGLVIAHTASLTIIGPPVAGTNTPTLSDNNAVWIQAGNVKIGSLAGVGDRAVMAHADGTLYC